MLSFRELSRCVITIVLAFMMLQVSVLRAASRERAAMPASLIVANGSVTVDGAVAALGQTLFPGRVITTSLLSSATLTFNNRTRLELADDTELKLDFSDAKVTGMLGHGELRVFAPAGRSIEIQTEDSSVLTDTNQLTTFKIRASCGETIVSVQAGRAIIRTGKSLRSVLAGETASTQVPNSSSQSQNLSGKKKLGLFALFGATAAILLVALVGRGTTETPAQPGGCIDILSGPSNCH